MAKNIYNLGNKEKHINFQRGNVDRETVKYTGQTIGGNTPPPLNCDGIELETKSVTIDSLNYTDTVTYDNTKYCGLEKVKISTNIPTDSNKSVTITSNTQTVISPNSGSEAMKQVTVTTNIPLEDNKAQAITSNGTTTITPTSGKTAMKKVTVTTNVPQGTFDSEIDALVTKTVTSNGDVTISPTTGKKAMKQAKVIVNVPEKKIQSITSVEITSNTITTINALTGYDGIEQVIVTTNINSDFVVYPIGGGKTYIPQYVYGTYYEEKKDTIIQILAFIGQNIIGTFGEDEAYEYVNSEISAPYAERTRVALCQIDSIDDPISASNSLVSQVGFLVYCIMMCGGKIEYA